MRRYPARRQRGRRSIVPDASFDVVSVLEEHRIDFPSLIIQSAPKRYLSGRTGRRAFVGYIGEISEAELDEPAYDGYKAGQLVGKAGLEKQYESDAARPGRRAVRRGRRARTHRARTGARARTSTPLEGSAALHEHRPRSAGVHRTRCSATRCRAARSRSIRRRARCSRSTARRAIDPNRFVGGVSGRRTTTRCATIRASRSTTRRCRDAIRRARRSSSRRRSWRSRTALVTFDDAHAAAVHRLLLVRQSLLALLGQGRTRQPRPRGRDRAVVRRVLLPARPEARPRATRRRRRRRSASTSAGIDLPEEKRPRFPDERSTTSTRSTARELEPRRSC